ncbi:MAG: IPT/TIG domain-containing protein [Spirochaetaceae bacterium]|nr:IPT/TIG domain-containing protein [Spirochaetaceae bacterium]
MKSENKLLYLFRKYPSVRGGFYLFICITITFAIIFVTKSLQKPPVITSLTPSTGTGGEVVSLKGKYFGSQRSDSYVELGGNRITASDYTIWTDTEISLVLPFAISDGLMYVVTPAGRSEPVVFTNKDTMPIPSPVDTKTTQPHIQSFSGENLTVGGIITISGNNFGSLRKESEVYFSSKILNSSTDSWISCSDFDGDYIFWGDQEITLRIPDGATSGYFYIRTQNGTSNKVRIDFSKSNGKKEYSDEHTYILSLGANIKDIKTSSDASVTFFMPHPALSAWQRSVTVTETYPTPLLTNYENSIIQQVSIENVITTEQEKYEFKNIFAVKTLAVNTSITNPTAKTQTIAKQFYSNYTKSNNLVQSDNENIKKLASSIIKKETSPYKKAQLIYNYIINNFVLLQENKPLTSNTLDVLETGSADAYDMALLFTTLARAVGIPAIMDSGVIVQQNMTAQNHWWAEFYLDTVGWIPVDPAMGAGLECEVFQPVENPKSYYFGNLDSQHITFSRDINNIKSSQAAGKKVYRPRSYALQSIWEEASDETLQYSSYWAPVQVLGVY